MKVINRQIRNLLGQHVVAYADCLHTHYRRGMLCCNKYYIDRVHILVFYFQNTLLFHDSAGHFYLNILFFFILMEHLAV